MLLARGWEIFSYPVHDVCIVRCVLEWKYRARVNATHSWEGRLCADITVEAGQDQEDEQTSSGAAEYADDSLFTNYEDQDDPPRESLMDSRLVNNYRPEIPNGSEAPESDPQAMPLQRQADQSNVEQETANRQLDIPLTEVIKELRIKNSWKL